jgi:hypothetical protein
LSDFDAAIPMRRGLPPRVIDPALLLSSKHADFVTYIPNPFYRKGAAFGVASAEVARLRNTRVKVATKNTERWVKAVIHP